MGAIVEVHHDEKGIVWPEAVAPFRAHLIEVQSSKFKVKSSAEKLYTDLAESGIEVLYDDREVSAGEKFADADLIGIPYRAVVSEKTGEKIEFKRRDSQAPKLLSVSEFIKMVQ